MYVLELPITNKDLQLLHVAANCSSSSLPLITEEELERRRTLFGVYRSFFFMSSSSLSSEKDLLTAKCCMVAMSSSSSSRPQARCYQKGTCFPPNAALWLRVLLLLYILELAIIREGLAYHRAPCSGYEFSFFNRSSCWRLVGYYSCAIWFQARIDYIWEKKLHGAWPTTWFLFFMRYIYMWKVVCVVITWDNFKYV